MNDIQINEEEENEIKITEYIKEKKCIGGINNLKTSGKAKFIEFIGGQKIIKANSFIEELKFIGGNIKLVVRAPFNKLSITGGESLIYIYPLIQKDLEFLLGTGTIPFEIFICYYCIF